MYVYIYIPQTLPMTTILGLGGQSYQSRRCKAMLGGSTSQPWRSMDLHIFLQLRCSYTTPYTAVRLDDTTLHLTTLSWPLQLQTGQLQPPFGPAVDSLCHLSQQLTSDLSCSLLYLSNQQNERKTQVVGSGLVMFNFCVKIFTSDRGQTHFGNLHCQ